MRRFRFRLDAALRVRSVLDRQARLALAESLREAANHDRAIASHARAGEQAASRMTAKLDAGSCTAGELKLWLAVRDTIFERAGRLGERRGELQQQVDERIEAHARTRRELRVLERLHERDLDAWKTEAARAEARESGELFLTRVARERAEGERS